MRAESRAGTTAAILASARRAIAEGGAGALSMRAVARELGMVSSAIYRYFPTREAVITAMVLESYAHLAAELDGVGKLDAVDKFDAVDDLDAVGEEAAGERWRLLAARMRSWALASPHEFRLIYGTPIPGYVAPKDTIPAAEAVVRPFLEAGGMSRVEPFTGPALTGQMAPLTSAAPGLTASGAAAVIAELSALVGFITLELNGHLVGSADPADHLFAALIDRQMATLGLARCRESVEIAVDLRPGGSSS